MFALYVWNLSNEIIKVISLRGEVIEDETLDNLKNLEANNNFQESVTDNAGKKINFFDKGGKRNWSKELSQDMKVQLEKALNKEMRELGYL